MKWISKTEKNTNVGLYGEHEYVTGFIIKLMKARTKYVRTQYQTLRKLGSTRSLIGSWKEAFGTIIQQKKELASDAPRSTHHR